MTLVEAIVAIAVLLTVSTAAITVVSGSMKVKRIAQDNSLATVLSAEGIELVRQIRDSNRIKYEKTGSGNWTDNIPADCLNGNDCTIDPTANHQNRMIVCNNICSPLKFNNDNSNQGYQYSHGVNSDFTRIINLNINGDIMQVTSTVSWIDQSGNDWEIVVRENLFDWQ